MIWDEAQAYVSWLSRTTGATYRLPTEAEWERAAVGSQPGGCYRGRTGRAGTCAVGSYGFNAAGLSDMAGNLSELTMDCWEGDCSVRVRRGGTWAFRPEGVRVGFRAPGEYRTTLAGFRVSRTLD